ncbi:MAG: signal peptidase I [Defluviitaleaceae bacterium]|nr:signal peptidase I [Defluviitaleaceae bacterium]
MKSLKLTVFVCIALSAVQLTFMLIPNSLVSLFLQAARPLAFSLLAVVVYGFVGLDRRPVRMSFESNLSAVFAAALYGAAFLGAAFFFGVGMNAMTRDIVPVLRNIWIFAFPVFVGELIRYKLVKTCDGNKFIVALIIAAFTFAQLIDIRILFADGFFGDAKQIGAFLAGSFVPALVLNAVLTYFAIRGSFFSLVSVSAVYGLMPVFAPLMPQINRAAVAMLTCVLAFVSTLIWRKLTDNSTELQKIRAKRIAKYKKKSFAYIFSCVVIFIFAATFFLQILPLYPVVVVSDSMAGTCDRGSMVFVQKIHGDAVRRVNIGEIIHYNQGRHTIVHRVVDFSHTHDGEREFLTRGDTNPASVADFVSDGDVLGIVRWNVPYVGYPYLFIRSIADNLFG